MDNKIKLQAKGTKPLQYQWFKDDEELSDGEDYEGSTTPELKIVGTGPKGKGEYKCQVSNKYGEVMSQEKLYCKSYNLPLPSHLNDAFLDPFISELKQKDLRDNEISKLIGRLLHSKMYNHQ